MSELEDFKKDSVEYHGILDYYKNLRAQRSQVPYINHIDEGLEIIFSSDFPLGQKLRAAGAYCIHPIWQSDEDFARNIWKTIHFHPVHVALAIEYRHVANNYLSTREIDHWEEIKLSPRPEVNLMLLADKIQNQKDFRLHHLGKHPRSAQLEVYFENWLQRLEAGGFGAPGRIRTGDAQG